MAVFVQDSFTDTDGTNLQGHVGEIGAAWTKLPGFSGNATINGNTLINGTSEAAYYASGSPAAADYAVSADYSWENSSFANLKIMGRADTSTGDHYALHYARSDATFRLQKHVSGSLTTLASGSQSLVNASTFRTHKLQLSGTNLEGFVDGVSMVSTSDATITAAGKAGLRLSGAANTRLRIDNFLAEDEADSPVYINPVDALHGHSSDAASLIQLHELVIDATVVLHAADAVLVAQSSEIIVSANVHAHEAEQIGLAQSGGISIASNMHMHMTLAPTLGQEHVLAILVAYHGHALSLASLGPEGIFPPPSRRLHGVDRNRILMANDGHTAPASQRRRLQPEI